MADFFQNFLGGSVFSIPITGMSFSNFSLDASGDKLEIIFQAFDASQITTVGIRYGVRTGTPPTYKVSLQGVGSDGNPNGTIKGGGSPASATFTPPADTTWNSTLRQITLDNAYTPTRGEMLAIVVEYSSGTISGSHNSSFTSVLSNLMSSVGFPYAIENAAGSRTRSSEVPMFWYGAGSTYRGSSGNTMAAPVFHADSTPYDEYGMYFSIGPSHVSTYTVRGVVMHLSIPAAGKTFAMKLYDDTTVLQDATFDTDAFSTNSAYRNVTLLFDEVTLSTLVAGTTYRIAFKGADSGTSLGIKVVGYNSTSQQKAVFGEATFGRTQRVDDGSWVNDVPRVMGGIIIGDWSPPVRRYDSASRGGIG